MRLQLFGYRVYISPRGFIVLGGLIVGLVVLILLVQALWPKSKPAVNFNFTPAFSLSYVRSGTDKAGWLGRFESSDGLFRPKASSEFRGLNFAPNVGRPFQLEVYIPATNQSTRLAPFQLSASSTLGKTFLPAYFIPPDQPATLSDLANVAGDPTDQNFIVVGFPANQLPLAGQAYSVKAMLWWRSDSLTKALSASTDQQSAVVPVFLADGYSALDPAQLRAPATQALDLELVYAEGGQQLTIHRLEWSAGNEVRMLITLTNLTNQQIPAWSGLSGSSASLAQQPSVAGSVDQESPLANLSSLDAQQSVTGYLVFGPQVADPSQELVFRLPSLAKPNVSGSQDLILIRVTADRLIAADGGQGETSPTGQTTTSG